jgi:hypothetical protein
VGSGAGGAGGCAGGRRQGVEVGLDLGDLLAEHPVAQEHLDRLTGLPGPVVVLHDVAEVDGSQECLLLGSHPGDVLEERDDLGAELVDDAAALHPAGDVRARARGGLDRAVGGGAELAEPSAVLVEQHPCRDLRVGGEDAGLAVGGGGAAVTEEADGVGAVVVPGLLGVVVGTVLHAPPAAFVDVAERRHEEAVGDVEPALLAHVEVLDVAGPLAVVAVTEAGAGGVVPHDPARVLERDHVEGGLGSPLVSGHEHGALLLRP